VFYSTNLYANGACYTAREKAEEHQLKDYLYAGDALVKTSIGMEMMVMGSPAFHLLIPAGNNWYESVAECELILDGPGDLVFQLGNMETGEKKKVCMKLPGLEKRPPKATRLKLELGYQSPKICGVTVQDLGFGDMYPSSKKTWRETIEWEE
jgi:hypothetical protein